jgi:hypothetical protein
MRRIYGPAVEKIAFQEGLCFVIYMDWIWIELIKTFLNILHASFKTVYFDLIV